MKIGEQSLLPAVRRAPADALVVADGFSCREQVRHATGRKPLHSAQLLQMAVGQTVGRPIERVVAANGHNGRRMRAALVVGATAVASAWMLARKGHNHEIQSARRGE
jgi:hypothetical protein